MTKTAYSTFWEAAPLVAASGLAVGGSLRLGKHVLDILRRGGVSESPVTMDKAPAAITSIPMEVTPEEAEELRRKGVKVKKMVRNTVTAKTAQDALDVSPPAAFGLGALGVGTLYGGWKLADKLSDWLRKRDAKKELEDTQNRIRRVLHDDPDTRDLTLHAQLKAAESFFSKTAAHGFLDSVQDTMWGPLKTLNPLWALLGGGATVAGIAAYQNAVRSNPNLAKAKAYRALLRKRVSEAPLMTLEPTVIEERPGSPAEQAEVNAVAQAS